MIFDYLKKRGSVNQHFNKGQEETLSILARNGRFVGLLQDSENRSQIAVL